MLRNLVLAYRNLIDTTYIFEIDRKLNGEKIPYKLVLKFREEDFHHLSGLHKLIGVDSLKRIPGRATAQNIYDLIISGKRNFFDVDKDTVEHKNSFLLRATALPLLHTMLETFQLINIYKFDSDKANSNIQAKYLLHLRFRDKEFYFLFDGEPTSHEKYPSIIDCYPVSFFRKKTRLDFQNVTLINGERIQPKNYELGQKRLKLIGFIQEKDNMKKVIYPPTK